MTRYVYKFLFCLSFCLLVSCSGGKHLFGNKEGDSKEAYSQNDYKLYEVLQTDTIASVARKFKVKTEDIIIINQIPKPYYLEPGTIIKIPLYDSKGDNFSREIEEIITSSQNTTSVIIAPQVKEEPVKEEPIKEEVVEEPVKEEKQNTIDAASDQKPSYETN